MKKGNRNESGSQAVIYLGPSFYGIMQKGTVFKGGYPAKIQALLEEHPFLSGLIIPTGQLAERRKQLMEKDSELFLLYCKAEQVKEEMHV